MKNWSIQNRVLVVALVPVVCIAVFLSVYFSSLRLLDVERSELEKAQQIVTHLARASEFAVVTANAEVLSSVSSSVLEDKAFTAMRILDEAGEVLIVAGNPGQPVEASLFTALRGLLSDTPVRSTVRAPIPRTTIEPLAEFGEVIRAQEVEPLGWVEIEVDVSDAFATELGILQKSMALTIAALIATALLGKIISRSVSNPIETLTATVDLLRQGYLDRRANTYAGGELGRLEVGINEMAATIQAAQHKLEEEVTNATAELKAALTELENRNVELEAARQAAQQASDFKSQFLANMSHEIRTPINVILGFSELLSKASPDPLQRDYVETIRGSAESLLSLLNDILDLSRVESGQMRLEKTDVHLNALLNDVHSLFAPSAHEAGIEFHVVRLPDKQVHVRTDPLRIRQVLINLVNNAIKFTREGHVLVVSEVIRTTASTRWVRFTVEDTGIGIPSSAQTTLFQAFSQGDMTTSRKFGGSGLGLHIASEIVLLMDGEIEFESSEGKGSRFWVTLPLEVGDGTSDATLPEASALPARVIEGYAPFATYYRHFFTTAGLQLVNDTDVTPRISLVNTTTRALRAGELPPPPVADGCVALAYCSTYDPVVVRRLEDLGYGGVLVKTSCPRKFRAELDSVLRNRSTAPDAPAPLPAAPEQAGATRERARILVIDDHVVNLKLVQSFGDMLSIDVDTESSPTRALAIASHRAYDLILMDLHMPEMDGRELTRRLRSGEGINGNAPIVALTADAYQSEAELIGIGMNARLVKPVSLESFRETVERWARRRAPGSLSAQRQSEIESELRGLLMQRLPSDRERLAEAANLGDYERLRFEAHKLRGAVLYCNVPQLLRAVEDLESACRAHDQSLALAALRGVLGAVDTLLATHGRYQTSDIG